MHDFRESSSWPAAAKYSQVLTAVQAPRSATVSDLFSLTKQQSGLPGEGRAVSALIADRHRLKNPYVEPSGSCDFP